MPSVPNLFGTGFGKLSRPKRDFHSSRGAMQKQKENLEKIEPYSYSLTLFDIVRKQSSKTLQLSHSPTLQFSQLPNNFRIFALHKKNSLLIQRNLGRKVRTSQSSIKVNGLPSRDEDKCNRKNVY